MGTGGDANVQDATVEHGAVTSYHETGQDVLQGLPEGPGVW